MNNCAPTESMLGVVAHLAHDHAALKDLLGLLSSKKMVLIDTTGLAPRDPRKREMMELLDHAQTSSAYWCSTPAATATHSMTLFPPFKQPTGSTSHSVQN
jgi:flagellar biosynthesis GTPase FlhF